MLQAAWDAEAIARDLTLERLEADRRTQLALSKALELVGEAAARLSPEFRNREASIDWVPIIGMRNRLVHEYWRINFGIVWDVATSEIPALIAALERLLPESPDAAL